MALVLYHYSWQPVVYGDLTQQKFRANLANYFKSHLVKNEFTLQFNEHRFSCFAPKPPRKKDSFFQPDCSFKLLSLNTIRPTSCLCLSLTSLYHEQLSSRTQQDCQLIVWWEKKKAHTSERLSFGVPAAHGCVGVCRVSTFNIPTGLILFFLISVFICMLPGNWATGFLLKVSTQPQSHNKYCKHGERETGMMSERIRWFSCFINGDLLISQT